MIVYTNNVGFPSRPPPRTSTLNNIMTMTIISTPNTSIFKLPEQLSVSLFIIKLPECQLHVHNGKKVNSQNVNPVSDALGVTAHHCGI